MHVEVKRFESPDETRAFDEGAFAVVRSGGLSIGQATYQPGWRWSQHVGPIAGTASCQVEHVGMVVSGRAMIAVDSGEECVVGPGDVFHVPPGHDSWGRGRRALRLPPFPRRGRVRLQIAATSGQQQGRWA